MQHLSVAHGGALCDALLFQRRHSILGRGVEADAQHAHIALLLDGLFGGLAQHRLAGIVARSPYTHHGDGLFCEPCLVDACAVGSHGVNGGHRASHR